MIPYPEQYNRLSAEITKADDVRRRFFIVLGVIGICLVAIYILWSEFGINTVELKTISETGIVYFTIVAFVALISHHFLQRKAYFVAGLTCYSCGKSSRSDTNWVCGNCGRNQRAGFSRRPKPFITNSCRGCRAKPHSFVCPHCRAPIIFDEKRYIPFQEAHKPGLSVDPAKVPLSHRSPPPGFEEPEPGFADVDPKPSPGGEFAEERS